MTERNVMAVVSDLIKTGLTVEQQILLNELVLVAADEQRESDVAFREEKAAYMREYRRGVRLRKTRNITPPPSPPMINNSTPSPTSDLAKAKSVKSSSECSFFEAFWEVFPRKVAKGAARKAFRHALTRAAGEEIIAGAKRYRPDSEFIKHPATWLNADCWLDEPERKTQTNVVGFRKELPPEREGPKISEEERQANLAKLATIKFGVKRP
jgi:hypothetical protein